MSKDENWYQEFYKNDPSAKLHGTLTAIETQLKSMNALLALLVAKLSGTARTHTSQPAITATQWSPTIPPKHIEEAGL